jgi:hypothetical protein
MITTTAHTLPGAYVGDPSVIATLTYNAIRNANDYPLAAPGATVAYRITDGTHIIEGDDLRAPLGFRSTPDDLLRSLCSFLANDVEHANYHDHGEHCHEYGDGCPRNRPDYLANLEQMVGAIDAASWIGE